jgi:hypothetical protein
MATTPAEPSAQPGTRWREVAGSPWGKAGLRVGLFLLFGLLDGPAGMCFVVMAESLALLILWLLVGDGGGNRLGPRLAGTALFLLFYAFCALVLFFLASPSPDGVLRGAQVLSVLVRMTAPILSGVAFACLAVLRERSVGRSAAGNPLLRIFFLVPAFMLALGSLKAGDGTAQAAANGLWIVACLLTLVGVGWDVGFIKEGPRAQAEPTDEE